MSVDFGLDSEGLHAGMLRFFGHLTEEESARHCLFFLEEILSRLGRYLWSDWLAESELDWLSESYNRPSVEKSS